ncbi:DUF983 domain-containing protein [Novosphingobium colocasiae]|uniref:Membrane protein n=1 Tax=Novosphingobium colocasiae TaxID=1256513 RepID=A0A918PJ32_9SPHN|nr:DUF983 domain-containing protein [Novosphingobium colocasiae]GGZ11872.1 membrane protein [Novosphingobium colocasiae]
MTQPGNSQEPQSKGQPDTASAALLGLCPDCGSKTLFDGIAKFAARCRVCGLDFSTYNVGDGPAAFLTFFVGAVIAGGAIWVQLAFEPPFWVHILLWLPLSTLLTVGGLRVAKAWLLIAEHRRKAGEGRLKD